jgi:hypothetical protein
MTQPISMKHLIASSCVGTSVAIALPSSISTEARTITGFGAAAITYIAIWTQNESLRKTVSAVAGLSASRNFGNVDPLMAALIASLSTYTLLGPTNSHHIQPGERVPVGTGTTNPPTVFLPARGRPSQGPLPVNEVRELVGRYRGFF